jgi:hypothetical protein
VSALFAVESPIQLLQTKFQNRGASWESWVSAGAAQSLLRFALDIESADLDNPAGVAGTTLPADELLGPELQLRSYQFPQLAARPVLMQPEPWWA